MARASRCFTGGRQCVGQPTLNKSNYMQLFRAIRKEREARNGKAETSEARVPAN